MNIPCRRTRPKNTVTCQSGVQAAQNCAHPLLPIVSKGTRRPNLNTGITYRCGPFRVKYCGAKIQTYPREGNNKCWRNCATLRYTSPAVGSLPGATDRQGCQATVEVSQLFRKMLSAFLLCVEVETKRQSPLHMPSTKPVSSASPTSFRTLSQPSFGVGTSCWSFSAAELL